MLVTKSKIGSMGGLNRFPPLSLSLSLSLVQATIRRPDWCNCNGLAITQRVTSWLIISTDNSTRGSETHEREKIILNRIITNIFAKRINCSIEGNIEKCKRGKFHHAFDKKKKKERAKKLEVGGGDCQRQFERSQSGEMFCSRLAR